MDPHDEIKSIFDRFLDALAAQDGDAFASLCVKDQEPQTELFLFNAEKLKDQGMSLRIREIVQEGEVAEVKFKVLDEGKEAIDDGMITMTLEPEGWRIRAL